MKLAKTKSLYLLMLLCLALPLKAEEPIPITLQEAKARALQNNLSLKQVRHDEQASRWSMLAAVSDVLPHISFNSFYTRFDKETVYRQNIMRDVIIQQYNIPPEELPPFAYRNYFISSISVDQPIYNGGIEITSLKIASTRKKQIHFTRKAQERETILQVETAYYNLCRAERILELRKNTLAVTRQYLDRFRRRERLGLITSVDVMRWEVKEANDEASLIDAENALELAQITLAHTMGSDLSEHYYPADLPALLNKQDFESDLVLENIDSLWENTRKTSPDLQIARSSITLEKHNLGLALANFQPKINFNYSYNWEGDNDIALDGFKQWTAGVSLTMPLFYSFGNIARWQEARIRVKRAEENASDFRIGLHLKLTATQHELAAAIGRLKSARKTQEQAREMLAVQENRHNLGLITLLELLDARAVADNADLSYANALFDALIAKAKLRRIAGTKGAD